jgi:hemerythrin-like domain-containing protein
MLFDILRMEHIAFLEELHRLESSGRSDRPRLMRDLDLKLRSHMEGEEESIYKAMLELSAGPRTLALRHEQEHLLVSMVLEMLREFDVDDEVWTARVHLFEVVLQHHFDAEENTLFPTARDHLEKQQLEIAENDYLKMREKKIMEKVSGRS